MSTNHTGAATALDVDDLRRLHERPFLGTLWTHGDRGMLTPRVCSAMFGDGSRALMVNTINQRPNYHVVRVDGAWGDDEVHDHMDAIVQAIADEFGMAGESLEEECPQCEDHVCRCSPDYDAGSLFPAIDDRTGCSWSWAVPLGDSGRGILQPCP